MAAYQHRHRIRFSKITKPSDIHVFFVLALIHNENLVLLLSITIEKFIPLHLGLTQLFAESRYVTRFLGMSRGPYGTFFTLMQRPAISNRDGGS